jgi:hypothetical protein
MMENKELTFTDEKKINQKKYFRIPERISHLVGVVVFYAAVFAIISILTEGLKVFNGKDPLGAAGAVIVGEH